MALYEPCTMQLLRALQLAYPGCFQWEETLDSTCYSPSDHAKLEALSLFSLRLREDEGCR